MASKILCQLGKLHKIGTGALSHQRRDLTANSLVEPFILRASGTQILLHARPYSDIPQPLNIDPDSPNNVAIESEAKNMNRVSSSSMSSSLNEAELAKFAAIAETWWDAEGPFKPLHVMNPTRLAFIRSTLCRHFR
ncbi:unnamed protein product [Ilex paraguariensis]|uniref:Uncharacterized protein n=1 Tax=Ilex paraguariensis TaxID=185542 RepID=A0ABC8R7J2_9AQUA